MPQNILSQPYLNGSSFVSPHPLQLQVPSSRSLSLQISSPSILYNGRARNLREYDLFAIKEVGWIGR